MKLATLSLLGMLALPLAIVGCGGAGDYKDAKKGQEVEKEAEVGPRGGDVLHAEPHDAIHLEMTFDEAKKLATLYVIEEVDGKFTDHPIANDSIPFHHTPEGAEDEATLEFLAVREDGATETAKFELPAESLPKEFADEHDIKGHVHLAVDSKDLTFDVSHDHEEHGHEHGHPEGDDDDHHEKDTDAK